MKFDSPYNPKEVEEKIYKLWEKSEFFNPNKLPGKRTKKFSVMTAPPNITGSLHLGHALENTAIDILIRMKRMMGFKTLWLPGMDHAGIATQNVVEKELRKQGISRHDLGREKFIEHIWKWKKKYGQIILDQFKKIGASMDWSRVRFTMDPDYQEAVREAFLQYYKKGWIYRGERTVNWCPRCATNISDLEVEYKEEDAELYYIKYGPLVIATVRPETKLGDTAVAVNPKDKRYKKYLGKEIEIETVLGPAKMRVVADPEVDMNFGTGAIKVTPAHDLHDFELSEKYNLEKKQVIGPDGKMTELAGKYAGLPVKEAHRQIVEDMKKIGILVKIEPYKHNIGTCYRCETTIEPILSKQWFLKMDQLAELAIKAVKSDKVKFHPKRWEKTYFEWLKNVRDWTISRQIWWGHRIPVWFHEPKCVPRQGHEGETVKCEEFVVSLKEPECEFCDAKFVQTMDVLDTWFSSALWPFATLGWPNKTSDLKTYYPTDYITSAREILNLWIARMIFSGIEFMGKSPFKIAHIHATILTREGKRMSKSLGTGVDPLDLIDKYGADAVRFGLIWQEMGNQDIHWSEEHVVAGKKFCNKIWNASRFVLMQQTTNNSDKVENPRQSRDKQQLAKPKTVDDKKILSGLKKLQKEVGNLIEKYEFGQALHKLYDFFWHQYADVYIETAKKQLANEKLKVQTSNVLLCVHLNLLKLLHPFLPFITEELWSRFFVNKKSRNLLLVENWPR